MPANGLMTVLSTFGARETMDRLQTEVESRQMTVFARIDHAAGGAAAGLPLRPTELLIFGSAKAGTPLMQSDQTIAIDLPLKVLVYQDAAGKVWLAYTDLDRLAARYTLAADLAPNIHIMATALAAITAKAAGA